MFSVGHWPVRVSLPWSAAMFVPSVLCRPSLHVATSYAPVRGRAGSHLLGHVPGVDQAHDLVPEIGGGPEHQRAAAVDHGDAVGPAVTGGGFGDAARPGAPVHPHMLDAELRALTHGVLGDLGPGSDHHRLNPARDRFQILIAPVPLDL